MRKIFLIFFTFVFSTTINATSSTYEKVIVFDFGGVIVHPNKTMFFEFIKDTFQINDIGLQEIRSKLRLAREAKIPESLFWSRISKEMNVELSEDWALKYEAVMLRSLNESKEMRYLIKLYKALGYRIALLSNVTTERANFFRSKGYYDDFSPVLLSCEIGFDKPDLRAYQIMLAEVQVIPENCIFIDDKQENIKAAKALGIDAILFLNPQQIAEELKSRLQ